MYDVTIHEPLTRHCVALVIMNLVMQISNQVDYISVTRILDAAVDEVATKREVRLHDYKISDFVLLKVYQVD